MTSDPVLVIECCGCSNQSLFYLNTPATFMCQKCGSLEAILDSKTNMMDKREGVIEFHCMACNREFSLPRGYRSVVVCPYCGNRIITAIKDVTFSSFIKADMKGSKIIEDNIPDFDYLGRTFGKGHLFDAKVKVAIPYFSNNSLVDRAVKTWIIPEVVFVITDEYTIPPGWGVCHQFFTPKNTKAEGLHESKTKPFLISVLKKLVEMFPNEDYYGFFNSDVILPPGCSIKYLLPGGGREIVFHHRLDLIGDRNYDTHVSNLTKTDIICCGKDGFIASKSKIEVILREFPDLVIGAPCWDDGLVVWSWKKFGVENVDLRFGEIWHVKHPLEWSCYDNDANYNQDELTKVGVPFPLRASINWNEVEKKTVLPSKQKTMGIVQPGRIGDVGIVLPIAKWYYDKGYKIIWPICSEYMPLFDYVNYVEPINIGEPISGSYQRAIDKLVGMRVDKIIDLGIGFGRREDDWIGSGLHFNEWKYKEAGVPLNERFNLRFTRNFIKEQALWEQIKKAYRLDGQGYNIIHDTGTKGPYRFEVDGVRVHPLTGYTVFDWIGVIERSNHLYCVDSCIANLADQLKLCVGRRSVWFWKEIPDPNPKRRALGFPKLCDDWKVL